MATIPYVNTAGTPAQTYPLVMFARSRHLNTAELTASHLRQFLKWLWAVQPIKNKLCKIPRIESSRGRYWKRKVPSRQSTHIKEHA